MGGGSGSGTGAGTAEPPATFKANPVHIKYRAYTGGDDLAVDTRVRRERPLERARSRASFFLLGPIRTRTRAPPRGGPVAGLRPSRGARRAAFARLSALDARAPARLARGVRLPRPFPLGTRSLLPLSEG